MPICLFGLEQKASGLTLIRPAIHRTDGETATESSIERLDTAIPYATRPNILIYLIDT